MNRKKNMTKKLAPNKRAAEGKDLGRRAAIAAVIIGFLALIPPSLSWLESRRANTIIENQGMSAAKVTVSAFSMGNPLQVDANLEYPGEPDERTKIPAAVLDITLKNLGDAPGVLTKARFTIVRSVSFEDCDEAGGPVTISGRYDVTLPVPVPKLPRTLIRNLRFEVPPKTADRLAFTIGPKTIPEAAEPRMYLIDVALEQDTGEQIAGGRIATIEMQIYDAETALLPFWTGSKADSPEYKAERNQPEYQESYADNEACMRRNSATLKEFAALTEVRSPEFEPLLAQSAVWLAGT